MNLEHRLVLFLIPALLHLEAHPNGQECQAKHVDPNQLATEEVILRICRHRENEA